MYTHRITILYLLVILAMPLSFAEEYPAKDVVIIDGIVTGARDGEPVLFANEIRNYSLSGRILVKNTDKPIGYAVITIREYNLWTVADEQGNFKIANIPQGVVTVNVSCLGYAPLEFPVALEKDTEKLIVYMKENNLALDEVVITAQRKKNEATTTYSIDRNTLDHAQILDVADISALLPGEATSRNYRLTTAQRFALRSGTSERGNASLGTAVEIDGVRISGNATMNDFTDGGTRGVDTRNISSSNIESIEVITGVPSVEYGDLTNGVVKINTRKGKSPLIAEFVMQPNSKQYTVGKGFGVGKSDGVVNIHLEHIKSFSDLASPYTSYKRNTMSVVYSQTFWRQGKHPLAFKAGFTGNIGGYDAESDPDYYRDTYEKQRDNVIRGFINTDWMIQKPWLTGITASVSVNYNDKMSEVNTYKSSVPPIAALHGTEEGYFAASGSYNKNPGDAITLIPSGTWYELKTTDSKYLDYSAKTKANWAHKIGDLKNNIIFGIDYSRSENKGKGLYYNDMNVAPTWREYRYDRLPATNNVAVYAQEQIGIPIRNTDLQLTAGVRSETTIIKGSEYGTVNSFMPRFNMKYNIPVKKSPLIDNIAIRAGWGEAVKLPTFTVLYPQTTYTDKIVFSPAHAYYTIPVSPVYNPDLKWQKERQLETGIDFRLKVASISLSFFSNKTLNPYISKTHHTPLSYNYTDYAQAESSAIAVENRDYSIDRNTGVVTISDKTGALPDEQLEYKEKKTFRSNPVRSNGSPIRRKGLEWIVDFDKIPALQTSFRLDGKYYYYKGLDETIYEYLHSTNMANGEPFQYIAYYMGASGSTFNGSISKKLNNNLTITTHIPKVRLIISVRIEACLYSYSQNISEYKGKKAAFVIDHTTMTPVENGDIYAGNQYIGIYPLYYSTYDDPDTLIPFEEQLEWARINDKTLFNELYKLIRTTSNNYTFNANKISAYCSANLSVTKEIGRFATISFTAKNFLNNMQKVKTSNNNRESNIYNSNYIPAFYYGLSLRIKI